MSDPTAPPSSSSVADTVPTADLGAPADAGGVADAGGEADATTRTQRALSCQGRCGLFLPDAPCACDASCVLYDDCCADASEVCGFTPPAEVTPVGVNDRTSCLGWCGNYAAAAPCQCDVDCLSNGDCCADWSALCGGPTGGACSVVCTAGAMCNQNGACVVPTCALPGPVTAGSLAIVDIDLLSENVGCDLNDDASPDNVFGKIVAIYASVNAGTLTDSGVSMWLTPGGGKGAYYQTLGSPSCAGDPFNWDLATPGTGWCAPWYRLPTKGAVSGGRFQLSLNVLGLPLTFDLALARLQSSEPVAVGASPMVCGLLPAVALDKAIDEIPDQVLKQMGFDKATIKSLIGGVLKPDVDTDGDKTPDAISVAVQLKLAKTTCP